MVGKHIRRVVGAGITQLSTHMTTKDYEGQISIVLGNPTHRKQDMADINCLEYFINDNKFFLETIS
jgi:hypothetical protein